MIKCQGERWNIYLVLLGTFQLKIFFIRNNKCYLSVILGLKHQIYLQCYPLNFYSFRLTKIQIPIIQIQSQLVWVKCKTIQGNVRITDRNGVAPFLANLIMCFTICGFHKKSASLVLFLYFKQGSQRFYGTIIFKQQFHRTNVKI